MNKLKSLYKCFALGLIYLIFLSLLGCSKTSEQAEQFDSKKTIKKLDSDFTNFKKLEKLVPNDSLRVKVLSKLSIKLINADSTVFRKVNKETILLAKKEAQHKILANAYWDLGYFLESRSVIDSSYNSYYLAYKTFLDINEEYYAGIMMLNMAISQEKARDYLGSENSAIRALKLIPEVKKNDRYDIFNNLAIVNNGLYNFDIAIDYHKKALEIAIALEDDKLILKTLNNISAVLLESNQFVEAEENLRNEVERNHFGDLNPQITAMILDNYSYARFKQDKYNDYLKYSNRALEIRDSLEDEPGIMVNKIRLGEYYWSQNDSLKAVSNLESALALASEEKNSKYELEALLKINEITRNQDYLKRYITLNQKLLKEERSIRSKFARIRFETDTYIEENKNLSERFIWMSLSGSTLLILILVVYIYQRQRTKFKESEMQNRLMDSNEYVYSLLLGQQKKTELGEIKERQRIARDLHDGILSRLFGTRMALGFLFKTVDNTDATDYLDELQSIEKEIRNVSHNLVSDIFSSEESFEKLIKKLIGEYNDHSDIVFDLNVSDTMHFNSVSDNLKVSIYYILQESIQNVLKHSQASHCQIQLTEVSNFVKLRVKDDGKGFDTKKAKNGIGLKNLDYRVTSLNGKIDILSNTSGTEMIFSIPYTDK